MEKSKYSIPRYLPLRWVIYPLRHNHEYCIKIIANQRIRFGWRHRIEIWKLDEVTEIFWIQSEKGVSVRKQVYFGDGWQQSTFSECSRLDIPSKSRPKKENEMQELCTGCDSEIQQVKRRYDSISHFSCYRVNSVDWSPSGIRTSCHGLRSTIFVQHDIPAVDCVDANAGKSDRKCTFTIPNQSPTDKRADCRNNRIQTQKETMRRKYRMRLHDVSETNDSIYRKGLVETGVAVAFRANHMRWMIKMGE